ncbi:MAG: hypothetical protein R2861_08325 [Desulfobacterales bacterium]
MTFAEITLDDSTSMGVEWSYKKGDANLSTSLIEATMGDSGLNFTIGSRTGGRRPCLLWPRKIR